MVAEGNWPVALALTLGAGLATTLGAAVVWCADVARPRLLAGSLGLAAGVMLFVSFAEILMRKSVAGFEAVTAGDANAAYRWALLAFFAGMALVALLDRVVHVLADWGARRSVRKAALAGGSGSTSTANLLSHDEQRSSRLAAGGGTLSAGAGTSLTPPAVAAMPSVRRDSTASGEPAPADATGRDVEHGGSAAGSPRAAALTLSPPLAGGPASSGSNEQGDGPGQDTAVLAEPCDPMTSAVLAASCPDAVVAAEDDKPASEAGEGAAAGTTSRTPPVLVEIMEADHHAFMLKKMGLLTALALFIHNFPEGLATFVGALADTKIGVGLAVAIAMHNIPEGICVAMPIYYATGSKWKGFWWAFLSGVSEPVGGLVGLLALNGNTDLSFAIVFGLVSGMMVYISVKELIPTALRYDPQDTVATTCVIAGMVVMAASLLLFTI